MKRFGIVFLLGIFVVAFAVHPIVHVEDHDGHACLLTLPGQETPHAAPVLDRPTSLFANVVPVAIFAGHRVPLTDDHLSRAPPSPL
jgi:hypothetical protein